MKVNFISEAEFTNNFGHGIWSVYRQQLKGLQDSGVKIEKNRFFGGDYDVVHMHTFGPFAYLKASLTKKPLVISCHTLPDEVKGSASLSQGLSMFFEAYLPSFYSKADVIVTPSAFTKDQLRKFHIKKSTYVVSNGVETSKFRFSASKRKGFRSRFGISDKDIVVYNVAQIIMRKGLDTFLEMARRMPDVKFVWIGRRPFGFLSGDYMKIRYKIDTAPKNVIFTGYVDNIVAAHSGGDIFLCPTHFENECIALLEAASTGRPAVVSDLPVFQDWLTEGKNCMKASSDEEFYKKLCRMVTDTRLRKRLGSNAKKVAEKKDIMNISKDLMNVYEVALKTHKKKTLGSKLSLLGILPVFVFGSMIIAFLYAKDKVLLNIIPRKN